MLSAAQGAAAQEKAFSLELNTARDVNNGCRLVYVAHNGTGIALDSTSYEVAVFDSDGGFSQLLILEFGKLPVGKTKVVQFDLPNQPCGKISRLLVNDVADCKSGGQPVDVCMGALKTSTRTKVGFDL
ncbi:hypothetical protein E4O86_22250 [Rhizobiales bacterium L72]|uniref:Tat pathway signal sequence domain protein n=1 Tax=Propylenella binzhouense TaxID=2555902 RepID=A0A964TAS4_9HYPH|nr:hypothetical protein [Propylenella binzhouense]